MLPLSSGFYNLLGFLEVDGFFYGSNVFCFVLIPADFWQYYNAWLGIRGFLD